jgi:hypothetical protein
VRESAARNSGVPSAAESVAHLASETEINGLLEDP